MIKIIRFIVFFLFFMKLGTALACEHMVVAPVTYYSRQDGDWNTAGTWSTTSHAGASCGCTPGCSPAANSTIRIAHIVTASCAPLNIGSNVDLIITGTGNFTLTGGGSLTGGGTFSIAVGGVMSVTGNVTLNGASTGTVNGTLNVFGNFTDSNGGNSTCGTGNINITGTISGATICGTVVLPIVFKRFTARQVGNSESIEWTTLSEFNNRVFEIERGIDGEVFEKIGEHESKAGEHGNSNSILNYVYEDKTPIVGYSYYRLKQVDYDNKFEYSFIVSVYFEPIKNIGFVIYPNPNRGDFLLDFSGIESSNEISVDLYNMNGEAVYKTVVYSESVLGNSFKITPNEKLVSGNYLVRIKIEGVTHTIKMIIE